MQNLCKMDFNNFFESLNAFYTTAELFYDNCWEELSEHVEGCLYGGSVYTSETIKYPAFAKLAFKLLFQNKDKLEELYELFSSKLVNSKLYLGENNDCEWSLRNMYTYNGYFTFKSPLIALREASDELS